MAMALVTQCLLVWQFNNNGLGKQMPVGLAFQCQCICQLNNSRLGNAIPVYLAPVNVSEFGKAHPLYCKSSIMALSLQMPVFHRLMCADDWGWKNPDDWGWKNPKLHIGKFRQEDIDLTNWELLNKCLWNNDYRKTKDPNANAFFFS